MTRFHAKLLLCFTILSFQAVPAYAQIPAGSTAPDRDASFLPPGSLLPSGDNLVPVPGSSTTPAPGASSAPPVVIVAPVAPVVSPPVVAPIASPAVTPVAAAPTVPVPAAPAQPAAPVAAAPAAQTPPASQAVDFIKPVEAEKIGDINPESIGLFSPTEGGLGAAMWKATPREIVDRLVPSLNLPTLSPALNNLAQRFLLTTASVPLGTPAQGQSLIAMRIENLVALGDVHDAWKLAQLAKPELIDDNTLRLTAEAALVSSDSADVCAKLPNIIKAHTDTDWQKLLLVCQLMVKDNKAAQLTLDLLHTQNVHDDVYFYLAERNIIGGIKQLPRQLTPLKALNLALLRLTDLPLPPELYVRPDASLLPVLLQAKAKDDVARLSLAEHAAEKGLVSPVELEAVYASITFAPDSLARAGNGPEAGVRLHALLYQAAVLKDASPKNRIDYAVKFFQNMTPASLNGAEAQVMADMAASVPASSDYNAQSGVMARIYTMAGKPQAALDWLKVTHAASVGMPGVAADVQMIWPATVFATLESDSDFAKDLAKWLTTALATADPKADNRAQRDQAAAVLLLLDADGFAVAQEDWVKVLGAPVFEKHLEAPALLLEYLRTASKDARRGETVLLSLLLSGNNAGELSLPVTLAIIRALRLIGLTADAAALARESATLVLAAPIKP